MYAVEKIHCKEVIHHFALQLLRQQHFISLIVKNMLSEKHSKAAAHELWLPGRETHHASLGKELRFIELGLVSIFGELVKYNCVILYKAVLGWQHPEKLHYSAFYWGVKKGTFCWWWITSLSYEVKVKHTHGGGAVLWRMYMDLLNEINSAEELELVSHNGLYLMPINTHIDLQVKSKCVRTERE